MAYSAFRQFAKTVIGSVAEVAVPHLARDIDEGRSTGRARKLKRAMIHARIQRAKWRGDEDAAKKAINDWWSSDVGDHFYGEMAGQARFEQMFMGPHFEIVHKLQGLVGEGRFSHLVEVGSGDGLVLNYLARNLEGMERFTGLDISERIIASNQERYSDLTNTRFEHADVLSWLGASPRDNTILLSYGGVMEYLTELELLSVYQELARYSDVAVALVEPLDESFDVARHSASRFVGTEHVYYCHNYADILRRAGYRLEFEEYLSLAGWPWVMLVARPERR